MKATQFLWLPFLLLAVPVPCLGQEKVNATEQEERAIAAIEDLGGRVVRDESVPERPVIEVAFSESIKDGDLEWLKTFPRLKGLSFSKTGITDSGLARLSGLTQLESLQIAEEKITDKGLAHLEGLSRLQELSLVDARITGPGLAHLKELTRLEDFTLADLPIRDEALAHLKDLPSLRWLSLSNIPITGAGLAHLKGAPCLQWVSLADIPITEAGLLHLKGAPRLRWLRIEGIPVTEAGTAKLKEALPYTLVTVSGQGSPKARAAEAPHSSLWRTAALMALGLGVGLCALWRPWRAGARRSWGWKLPLVLAPILLVGDGLSKLASRQFPVQEGDAASFWLCACEVDIGMKHFDMLGGSYQPRDGWFIYYFQWLHEQPLYRVKEAEARALFPRVVQRLHNAPPGALDPDVEAGFAAWRRADPGQSDAPLLLANIREARLARLRLEDREWYQVVLGEEDHFGERWGRIQRYSWNVTFEFVFLAGLILFAAWPWLRGSGRLRWAVHFGLVPVLFVLPYWLGYAPLTFTTARQSGGVLYPTLLVKFRGLPWTPLDPVILRSLPRPLEPLSQTPGSMMVMSGFGAVGPVAVLGIALAIGGLIAGGSRLVRRVRQLGLWREIVGRPKTKEAR
jgi:hypothetical protein